MHAIAQRLRSIVQDHGPRLRALADIETSRKRSEAMWSHKEILGHLIDSAGNNLQRFVRVQAVDELRFPSYKQAEWQAAQACNEEPWLELVVLWEALNRHVAHVIEKRLAPHAQKIVHLEGVAPMRVDALAEDYMRHLEHHLAQMAER